MNCTVKLLKVAFCIQNTKIQILNLYIACFPVSHKTNKSRPASAGVFKEPDSLSAQAQSNQQAIVAALKKLVEKQAARQYSSSSHISLLTQHVSSQGLIISQLAQTFVAPVPTFFNCLAGIKFKIFQKTIKFSIFSI